MGVDALPLNGEVGLVEPHGYLVESLVDGLEVVGIISFCCPDKNQDSKKKKQ